MKLDKDFLVKNQFWIGLGVSTVLLLVLFCMLKFSVSTKPEEVRKKHEDSLKSLKAKASQGHYVDDKPEFLQPWIKRKEEFASLKGNIWEIAWEPQQNLMTWPHDDPRTTGSRFVLEKKADFGASIPEVFPKFLNGRQIPNYLLIYKEELYKKQFPQQADLDRTYPSGYAIARLLHPELSPNSQAFVNFPVAFEGSLGAHVRPVQWDPKQNPTSEEAWLAQEDLWLRRGIVRLIKDAMDRVSRCQALINPANGKNDWPIPDTHKGKVIKRRRFQNMNWELDILVEKVGGKARISADSVLKNISPTKRPRPLVYRGRGLTFLARQAGQNPRYLEPIVGVILPHGGTTTFKVATSSDALNFEEDFSIEQVFTLDTSPIKSILATEIASERAKDQRTSVMAMNRDTGFSPAKASASTDNSLGGGFGGGGGFESGGMSPPGSMPPGGGMAGMNAGGTAASQNPNEMSTTHNGLVRDRYLVVNEQVRRIPIAFAVMVDQPYIPDILAAVANSKMKIQTTQVFWRHRPDYQVAIKKSTGASTSGTGTSPYSPAGPGGTSSPPGIVPPGAGGPGEGNSSPVTPPGAGGPEYGSGTLAPPGIGDPSAGGDPGFYPPGAGYPGGYPGAPGTPGTGAEGKKETKDEPTVESNLVEVTIYGIATLYERFDPKKAIEQKADTGF